VHGLLFTAWVLLFLLQAMLVATRRVKLHMRLGIAGAALPAVMVVVGVAAGVIYDIFSRRKVHPVYMWGGLLMVAFVPGRLALSGTAMWRSFAEFLTR
jgi:hypothetical protein